jgi:magnesium chelatase family protein
MLARRVPGILPPPSLDEALEITQIESAGGIGNGCLAQERPFRAPHHTVSPQGLVGGGAPPRPGEITLAHRGVLFLDELAEFARDALDSLRQPLEDGCVQIMRRQRAVEFPARSMLVAACNPCPCAKPADRCSCGPNERGRYARRLSGPLLDRVDLACQVDAVPLVALVAGRPRGRDSSSIRAAVVAARERQRARLAGTGAASNGEMGPRLTRRFVAIDREVRARLLSVAGRHLLSARGHDRVLRVARTIADLDGRERVRGSDVDEALGYRVAAWDELVAA